MSATTRARARRQRLTSALPQQQEAEKQGSGGISKQQQISSKGLDSTRSASPCFKPTSPAAAAAAMNNKGSYPQQAVYPQQSTAPVYPPAMQMSPQAPPYTDTPPAYSEIYQPRYVLPPQVQGHQMQQMSSHYPGAQMFMPMQPQMAVGQMGQNVPMAYYPMGAMYPHGSTVMVDSGFDAGARFTQGSNVSIPPPPPGHPPNAAQLAAMQGANVVMSQRKSNFFLGGSTGGYTIW